jgi:hypothetical protein
VHTVETTAKGLSGQLRTADGVVLLGAGYLVLHEVFDGEQFLSRRSSSTRDLIPTIESGPPDRQSDLNLFCDAGRPHWGGVSS